jgi:hypothetical protein
MWPGRTEACVELHTHHVARRTFVNWYLQQVHAGGATATLVLLRSEVCFHWTAHVHL